MRRAMKKLLLASMLLTCVGCSKGLTDKDVERIIDERVPALVQKKLEEEHLVKPPAAAAPESPRPPHLLSLEFLAKLDALMEGYVPTLPTDADQSDMLRCSTKDEIASNKELSKIASLMKGKDAARAKALLELERNRWMQYRIDYSFATRSSSHPEVRCCSYQGQCQPANYCDNPRPGEGWVVTVPARPDTGLYSGKPFAAPDGPQPPELMKRIKSAGLPIPDRFSCLVSDVVPNKSGKRIACTADKLVGPSIRVAGNLPSLHIGDVVSVPLKDTKRDPDGVLLKEKQESEIAWVVDADGASVKVESPAVCPSIEQIVAAASKSKK